MTCMQARAAFAPRQDGAVLIVGLIMVLLMTIVGLAAIRGSGLQETMAGNMRERNVAFQSAEAGLRQGEEFVVQQNLDAMDFSGSTVGYYPDLNQPDLNPFDDQLPLPQWTADKWPGRSVASGLELDNVGDHQPRYVIEELSVLAQKAAQTTGSGMDMGSLNSAGGLELKYYRTSSRGVSASGNSDVIVQSTYRKN